MLSSLSSVPPVWPRPRPEIIGTEPPQAATIGASSRLTLSPTPPVECLSRIRSPSHASTSPERVIAPVRAIRSVGVMPRHTIAIASAPTCASLTDPSVMPATRNSISSAVSSPPSRLRRISSAASNGLQTLHEARDQRRGGVGPGRGGAPPLLVAEGLVLHALGEVRYRRHRGDAQAAVPRDDRLVDGRHADGVGTERAERADLGRRLEARTADREVDAVCQGDLELVRRGLQPC